MKKSLVLAMAMALGVTASAYAANPFSDVPAGHWAYDSVSKLAAAGVIEGYGDTTFGGDKLMTRYEMAQIVAKAMARGANVDRLAAEFADELDTLGVRVANLEKKADNVKITGQIRAHYRSHEFNGDNAKSVAQLRTRLFVNGQINDDWSYTGRLQNIQELSHDTNGNKGDDDLDLNWAFVTGRVGGMAVQAGRQDIKMHTGSVVDTTFDAVKVAYGKDVKLTGYAAKATGSTNRLTGKTASTVTDESEDRVYIADLSAKLGKVDAYATYYKFDVDGAQQEDAYEKLFVLGASANLAKDVKLNAEWLRGDAEEDMDKNGYMVGLAYKGAKAAKAGSWGLFANYFNQPDATYVKHTITGYTVLPDAKDGFKGFEVGANYAIAKNIVADVKYYDLDAREGNDDVKTLWTDLIFTF